MGSIYKRGDRYYIRFKDQEGKWVARAASDNLAEAKKVLREVEKGLKDLPPSRASEPPSGEQTIRECLPAWTKSRRDRGVRNWQHGEYQFTRYILPYLGDMRVTDVRVRHVRDFVDSLRQTTLAPRSILHVHSLLKCFFSDLVINEVVPVSPCVLTKDYLPKNRDLNPEWRAKALFTREEVGLLICSPDIPPDRQMLYALMFLTGARFGEIAGLRWRDLDEAATPLKRLIIAHSYNLETKTKNPRQVPVHPVLASMLTQWKESGWHSLTGSMPEQDSLIVPTRGGKMRNQMASWPHFKADQERLGLRHRRQHDTRRTFITLARVDGARKDILEQITHGPRGSVLDMYTTLPWTTLCEAMVCLKVTLPSPDACTEMTRALVNELPTKQLSRRARQRLKAEASGKPVVAPAPIAEGDSQENLPAATRPARTPRVTKHATGRIWSRHEVRKQWNNHVKRTAGDVVSECSTKTM